MISMNALKSFLENDEFKGLYKGGDSIWLRLFGKEQLEYTASHIQILE